jgi:putative sterol carrier protein
MPAKEFFDTLPERAKGERIDDVEHSYVFDIAGEGRWLVEVRDGAVKVTEGYEGDADAVISTSDEVFERIVAGTQNPMTAYMTGKIKLSGDLSAALKLQSLF